MAIRTKKSIDFTQTATRIDALVLKTETGYSYDRYSAAGWKEAIRQLVKLGFSDANITAIMLSKWTRWAADMSGQRYGDVSSKPIIEYVLKHQGEVEKLTQESAI